jgi:regulator of sigma E protease
MIITIIAFIFVIGILITVHEVGHFVAAKLSGIKVEEFSIGFPPRIFSFKKKETKYTIGALPFGGYVKMLGEDTISDDPRAYNRQSPGKRLIVSVAGVLMNFLLAWLLLTIGFSVGMTPIATPSDQINGTKIKSQVFIAEIMKNSPADKAGLAIGDELIKGIDGSNNTFDFQDLNNVTDFTQNNLGKEVKIDVKRQNEELEKIVTISDNKDAPLGVGIVDQAIVRVPVWRAPYVALREGYEISRAMFTFLGSFFHQLFAAGQISDQVGGPVAIFNLSGSAARAGVMALLQFITLLSINLGLINIMPFPALDGGRALFIILEKIFGKKVIREDIENLIHTIGFGLLIVLIIAITYKDIIRLIYK